MQRHVKLIHDGSSSYMMNTGFGRPTNNYSLVPNSLDDDHSVSKEFPFRGFSKFSKEVKNMTEYNESLAKANALSLPNIQKLQGLLNVRNAELSDIRSNYWLIHVSKIQGISGYYCKRCQRFEYEYVKNPGYDMTVEAGHVCDESKVKSIPAVSVRKMDIDSPDDFIGTVLLEHLNFTMPGVRYFKGKDFSREFDAVMRIFGYDYAIRWLGVPDRFCLYRINESKNLVWLDKAIKDPHKINELNEDEVIDFLGKVKSSYALLEIPTLNSPRMLFRVLTI